MRKLVWSLMLLAPSAMAQELPPLDARIASLPVRSSGLQRLQTASDVTQTILFRPDERITSVILSDPAAYFVNVAGTEDSLALRAGSPSAFAVMTVRTNLQTHEFELASGAARNAPAVVRLVSAAPASPACTPSKASAPSAYRLSGSKSLRPTSISDDGLKTYIEWSGDQAVPATFALGPTGEEQMVDGYMRDGRFTIDRVYEMLIFRIDKERAKARRQLVEDPQP